MTFKTKIAVGNLGAEELAEFKRIVLTRQDTRAEADVLFGGSAAEMRKRDRGMLEKLFVQTPGAQTMAPNLQQKTAAVVEMPSHYEVTLDENGKASGLSDTVQRLAHLPGGLKTVRVPADRELEKTSAVDAFFARATGPDEAQTRYPELLKVAQVPSPTLKRRPTTPTSGPVPARASISGGAA